MPFRSAVCLLLLISLLAGISPANPTVTVTRTQGGEVVEERTVSLNQLGQPDSTVITGTGRAATDVDPEFRDDGSLASFSLTVGGVLGKVVFEDDGTIQSLSIPNRQNPGGPNEVLPVDHEFPAGEEVVAVDGTTAARALDGSANSLSGAGVMDRDRSTVVSAGGFAETIDPGEGASTVLSSNAAGTKTLHHYAAGAATQTTWLAGGLLESISLGRGGSTFFGYSADGARELESIAWLGAASSGFVTEPFYGGMISLGRDAAGNIDSIIDPSGERDLDYGANRLTTTDWLSGELDDYEVVRAYDPQGRLDSVTLFRKGASVHAIGFGYTGKSDEINGVTAEGFSASYAREPANRSVTGVTRGPVVQTWGRGAAGRITSAGSNVTGAPDFGYATFDSKGRRKTVATNKGTWTYSYRGGDGGDGQLVNASATGNDLGTFAYGFDGIGRRVDFAANRGDLLNRFLGMTHPQQDRPLFISADPAARVWYNGIELHPAPDDFDGATVVPLGHPGSAGGWVAWEVEAVLENAGDPGAHPDAVAEFSGHTWFPPQQEDFTYDGDGNRDSSALWDYGWDGRNRLVRAATRDRLTAPEGWDLRFDYDAEGRRFKKEVIRYENGVPAEHKVIHFVWDGWDLIYERHQDGFGNLLFDRKYVWGLDIASSRGGAGGAGGLLLMRETRGQTERDFYPLYDGSGHVVGLADGNGDLVAEYWHGPFGELIQATGEMADANPWRYATKYHDKETGLYYFGHRYYDPVTGQWLNREPLGEDESLNLYSYAGNDPINYVDALGLAKVATDGRGNLNAYGMALAALARQDPKAARILLLAAQVQAETHGAGIERLVGDGGGGAISNVLRAIRTASGNARADGRNEWKHIVLEARLGAGAAFDFDAHVPSTDALTGDLFAMYSPLLTASGNATAAFNAARSAESARMTALQNSPGYKIKELALGTADLPMGLGAALFSGAMATDVTTGSAVIWNGWGNAGFRLAEVSPGERAFAAGLMFIPVGRGGSFVDDFARGGRGLGFQNLDYRRFRSQGFTPAQSRYLLKPYPASGMGHHFIGRQYSRSRGGWVPDAIVDSRLNIMGRGLSRGRFYELHFKGDPHFFGTGFPKRMGGSWSGVEAGLEKVSRPFNLWYASPDWLRYTAGGAAGAGTIWGGYELFGDE